MFLNTMLSFIHNSFEKNIIEIEQDLILEHYISSINRKSKGVKTLKLYNEKELFKEILIIGDTANVNKFMLLSQHSKFSLKEASPLFIFSFEQEDLINSDVLFALNKLQYTYHNLNYELAMFKMYKNQITSYRTENFDNYLNYFYAYFMSFATSNFLIKRKHDLLLSKITSLVENQLSSLPTELPYIEEMKIINKISDFVLKSLTNTKKTKSFIINDNFNPVGRNSLSSNSLESLKNDLLDYNRKIVYIDLIFKKNIAVAKYIIPFLIKKVKLSNSVIERFISLCKDHLIMNLESKIINSEIGLSLDLIEPFRGKTIFTTEFLNEQLNYRRTDLFSVLRLNQIDLSNSLRETHNIIPDIYEEDEDLIPF